MNAAAAPTPDPAAWTVGRLLDWTRQHFEARGVDPPRLSAELLLAEALGCRKIELYTRFEQTPPATQVTRFRELVVKAARHEPIAYLLGRREFFSLEFAVSPDVLIPRPETETLVERGLAFLKSLPAERLMALDMGTGSGCIAVAVAKFEPRAVVVASDISAAAVAVARANAERHGVAERVHAVVADGLDLSAAGETPVPRGGFDLLLSNPPYIAEEAVADLPENIREYEPRVALAAGDGLTFYRRIATEAGGLLRPGGRCYVEIGMGQAAAVLDLFGRAADQRSSSAGWSWAHVGTWRDLAGLDRVVGFERRP